MLDKTAIWGRLPLLLLELAAVGGGGEGGAGEMRAVKRAAGVLLSTTGCRRDG